MTLLQKAKCFVGWHDLHVVHRFGAAALVACPDCEREFAMHDGLRVFLPWDGDIEALYVDMGYDVGGSRAEWRRQKRPYPVNQLGSFAHPEEARGGA